MASSAAAVSSDNSGRKLTSLLYSGSWVGVRLGLFLIDASNPTYLPPKDWLVVFAMPLLPKMGCLARHRYYNL